MNVFVASKAMPCSHQAPVCSLLAEMQASEASVEAKQQSEQLPCWDPETAIFNQAAIPYIISTTILPQLQPSMFSGEQARQDAAQAEYEIRTAAFMGLRIMTDQAVHLARQGIMIPHLYPQRQLSVLSEAPTPLGMAAHCCHTHSQFV